MKISGNLFNIYLEFRGKVWPRNLDFCITIMKMTIVPIALDVNAPQESAKMTGVGLGKSCKIIVYLKHKHWRQSYQGESKWTGKYGKTPRFWWLGIKKQTNKSNGFHNEANVGGVWYHGYVIKDVFIPFGKKEIASWWIWNE